MYAQATINRTATSALWKSLLVKQIKTYLSFTVGSAKKVCSQFFRIQNKRPHGNLRKKDLDIAKMSVFI